MTYSAEREHAKYLKRKERLGSVGVRSACPSCGIVRMSPEGTLCRVCKYRPASERLRMCQRCGGTFDFYPSQPARVFCSWDCYMADRTESATSSEALRRISQRRHMKRRMLLDGAEGLSRRGVERLRDKWKRQGRACVYCGEAATTADHVIPLSLGGSNREGNLVPCCHSCNASKQNDLLAAWRYGARRRREIHIEGVPCSANTAAHRSSVSPTSGFATQPAACA